MYAQGLGVTPNQKRAFHLFRRAAQRGLPEAQYEVGVVYLEGVGTESNLERACEWFRMGAEQGNPESQCRLGTMYALGQGVAQDDRLALEWLKKSAAQGLSNALFALDVLYPDDINRPRVPPEIVPRVERFVEEMLERVGRDRPDVLARFERLSTSDTEAGSEELAIGGCAHKSRDIDG